jgi:Domain of unknown function (DUF4262)
MKNPFAGHFKPELDTHEQQVLDNISEHGCQVQFVFDPEGERPDFSYSIGFPASVGQPEVLVYGLRNEVMHSMVNTLRQQCVDGLKLCDGARVAGLLEGFECVLRHITDRAAIKDHFGWAIWYHRRQLGVELNEAYQVVWPGAQDGFFPWDEACDQYVRGKQPALYNTSLNS